MNKSITANEKLATFILRMTSEETEKALSRLNNPDWLNAHGIDPDDQENLGLLRTLLQFAIH